MDNTNQQKEKESIITDHYNEYTKDKLRIIEKKIRKSRDTLFIVAGLTLLAGLIMLKINGYGDGREFKYTIFISLVFAALAFVSKKEPFIALVTALIIYIGLWLLTVAVGGAEFLFKGIIAKVIIIFFIASGIPHAHEADELKKELKKSAENL